MDLEKPGEEAVDYWSRKNPQWIEFVLPESGAENLGYETKHALLLLSWKPDRKWLPSCESCD